MSTAPYLVDLLGFSALAIAAAIIAIIAYYRPQIALPLAVGLSLRIAAALFHHYIAPLPDGTADAPEFEQAAWDLANGPGSILQNYHYTASFLYSALMASLYEVTARSVLMLQACSVLVGTLCIFLTWAVSDRLWEDARIARASAWLAAIFPTAILYSALTMRETYWAAILMAGIWAAIRWVRTDRLADFALSATILLLGVAFHPGIIGALAVLAAALILRAALHFLTELLKGQLNLSHLALFAVLVGLGFALIVFDPHIPKFGHFSQLFDAQRYLELLDGRVKGSAAYPDWTTPNTAIGLLWALPVRAAYLMASPFPWDVSAPAHMIGVVDAMLYLLLLGGILGNGAALARSRSGTLLFLMLVALVIVFGLGTGNFGTALRHRTKLVFLLIVLASPTFSYLGRMCARLVAWSEPGPPPQPAVSP